MFTKQTTLRDLGNGLVLRRSNRQDTEALAEFNRLIHSENAADGQCLAAWTRDLLTTHPTFHPHDFTVIEELATGNFDRAVTYILERVTGRE